MLGLVAFYKENAAILRRTFEEMGFEVYGGENAPYVWVGFPGGWALGAVLVRWATESASWVPQVRWFALPGHATSGLAVALPCPSTSTPMPGCLAGWFVRGCLQARSRGMCLRRSWRSATS